MELKLENYHEDHPHRLKRIVWRIVNSFVYPLFNKRERVLILRLFGAKIGKECFLYRNVKIYAPWNLTLGDAVCIGPRVEIYNRGKVTIGSQIVISQDAYLCTASHNLSSPNFEPTLADITIGSQCWVAAKVSILPGVTIGDGSVVGACAVVAKSIPEWSIAVGNPARVVGTRRIENENANHE